MIKTFKQSINEDLDNSGRFKWDTSSVGLDVGQGDYAGGSGLYEASEKWKGVDDEDTPFYPDEHKNIQGRLKLSDDEKRSGSYYTYGGKETTPDGHKNINDHLRGKFKLFHRIPKDVLNDHVKNIDSLIDKHTLNHNTHVWRGITNKAVKKFGIGKKDHILHDKGFVSTSMDPEQARKFSNGIEKSDSLKPDHLVHIRLPKGTKAAYLHNSIGYGDEHEVLLPRDSRFKYSHTTQDHDGLIKTHHYDYLGTKE